MKLGAVIFDMDGLMLDSERVYRQVFDRAAADCSIDFPDSLHEELLGRNSADLKTILRQRFNDQLLFDRFMDCSRRHHDICFAEPLALKPGLLDLLTFLESKNIPKVVATSTPRARAISRLTDTHLLHRFHSISAGDEIQNGKPAPDLFLLAATTLPMPPEKCLVLEDSEAGVTAAHAAGMTVCMVPDIKQPSPAIRQKAHAVYRSLTDVQAFLHEVL